VSVFAVVVPAAVPEVEVVAVEPAVLVSVVVDVVAVVPVADVSVVEVTVPVVPVAAVSVEVPVVLELLTAVSVEVAVSVFAGSSFLQPNANSAMATRASRVARVVFFICTVLLNFPDLAICFFRTV